MRLERERHWPALSRVSASKRSSFPDTLPILSSESKGLTASARKAGSRTTSGLRNSTASPRQRAKPSLLARQYPVFSPRGMIVAEGACRPTISTDESVEPLSTTTTSQGGSVCFNSESRQPGRNRPEFQETMTTLTRPGGEFMDPAQG